MAAFSQKSTSHRWSTSCLVLLIIFMVVTPLLQQGMTVSMPTRSDQPGRGSENYQGGFGCHLDPQRWRVLPR